MTDVIVVTNEPIRPPLNGGRVRMAAIVDALSARLDVTVRDPTGAPRRSLLQTFRPAPRRGTAVLDRTVEVGGARLVLYSHSYLEPVGPHLRVPVVVDFPNLEVERQRSLAAEGPLSRRASAAAEALKARWWEPRTARRAAIAVAVTEHDAAVLRAWGAGHVIVVPNASATTSPTPSPAAGPVTFVANATYTPNALAGRRLLDDIWPLVRVRAPEIRLRIAGRGTADVFAPSADVEVLGEVDDIGPVFADASLVVAPVDEGGGTQLKVVEALAHGRVVVASAHSATSAPRGAEAGCVATSSPSAMADAIVALHRDVSNRHRRELAIRGAVPTWAEVTVPLVDAVEALVRGR